MESIKRIDKIEPSKASSVDIAEIRDSCYAAMNDDFNTPTLVANLFEAVRVINSAVDKTETLSVKDIDALRVLMNSFVFEVLGLVDEGDAGAGSEVIEGLMDLILDIRKSSREKKDWSTSDLIRDQLQKVGIQVKDTKDGAEWRI